MTGEEVAHDGALGVSGIVEADAAVKVARSKEARGFRKGQRVDDFGSRLQDSGGEVRMRKGRGRGILSRGENIRCAWMKWTRTMVNTLMPVATSHVRTQWSWPPLYNVPRAGHSSAVTAAVEPSNVTSARWRWEYKGGRARLVMTRGLQLAPTSWPACQTPHSLARSLHRGWPPSSASLCRFPRGCLPHRGLWGVRGSQRWAGVV